ncbi:peptide chain release factor 3, partial [mine drainage metagenome]
QALQVPHSHTRLPLLAAVGPLQFEVMQYRLQSEYGAETRFEKTPWSVMRWLAPEAPVDKVEQAVQYKRIGQAMDDRQQRVLLFPDEWALKYFQREHADLVLYELPPEKAKSISHVAT